MSMNSEKHIYTKEDMVAKREELISTHGFKLLNVFDTFEKTSETKDVFLVEVKSGEKRIIRIGETRPHTFFPNGYMGKYLMIPRIFEIETTGLSYEIEEYIEGTMACDLNGNISQKGEIKQEVLELLINAFWEFQTVGNQVPLTSFSVMEKVEKHFEKAKEFLPNPDEIKALILKQSEFLNTQYPSKWKYALDNLIITKEGKVCFIDNVNVGLRHFGYDLGWLIWPLWLHMKTEYYETHFDDHLRYLESVKELVKTKKPDDIEFSSFTIDHAFWFVVFERVIGALFDVGNQTRHLAENGIDNQEGRERTEKHVQFLHKLLEYAKVRLD